jgi:hypothetical protein
MWATVTYLDIQVTTRWDIEDRGDVRRNAHNPATIGRSVTATTPHNDSTGLTAATTRRKVVAPRQVAAKNLHGRGHWFDPTFTAVSCAWREGVARQESEARRLGKEQEEKRRRRTDADA